MRLSTATPEELAAWYRDEIDASAEGDLGDLEKAREACRAQAVEHLAERAERSFLGDKASRGETAGGLTDYILREFRDMFGRDAAHQDGEDWSIVLDARSECSE